MIGDENTASPDQAVTSGKTPTWWHPLLVRLLKHMMATVYEVDEEVFLIVQISGRNGDALRHSPKRG